MECNVCGSREEVERLPIYIMGSEGVDLCLHCRLTVTEVVRGMLSVAGRRRLQEAKWMLDRGITEEDSDG
jgi:hypothetical protein